MKNLIIVGAGGVGKETTWIIEQINQIKEEWNIVGFIDDNESIWNSEINGYKVLGGVDYLKTLSEDIYVVIAIANYKIKKTIVEKLENKFKFATIIHPEVYITRNSIIGHGSIVYPTVIMTTNINIGNHVIVSPKCGIGHDSIIKDYVSLLWNVNISGFDIIGEGTLIGSGATIIQNIKVGKSSIIGAGSVVVRDTLANKTMVGIPAKEII